MPAKKDKNRLFALEVYGESMWTLNKERTVHFHTRAKWVKEWREATAVVAEAKKLPKKLKAIEVVFTPHRRNRRGRADTGGHFPVAKACIDGLVDSGIILEDGPDVVRRLTFEAPVISGESKVVLTVRELEE